MVKQIESEKSQNLTFKRRIRCIKKKTMELSTHCGIMACSVVLGPNGDIQTWPENSATVRSVINFYDDQCVPSESQTEGRIEAGDESLRAAKMQEKIDEIEKEIDATKKENSRKLEALRMAVSRLNLLTKRVESAKAAANSVLERQSDDTMEK